MIELVLTVMISAFSLAQPGQGAITTNELPPPPGMSAPGAPAAPQKPGAAPKTQRDGAAKPAAEKAPAPGDTVVVENAAPVKETVTPETATSGTEAAQPTTEERQAPTQTQASGSAGQGRVAAFWFILPNRPTANK